jgi:hypothetical protein
MDFSRVLFLSHDLENSPDDKSPGRPARLVTVTGRGHEIEVA